MQNDIENIEEWRDVEGYEGLYQISNLGQIKSLRDNKGNYREKILRPRKSVNGYLFVDLCKDGICKKFNIHRLVALAFIENPNGYRCVNHKDECKTNNVVDNLEWCTQKYNINYGTCIQRRAEKLTNRQDLSRQVYQYDKDGELIKIWESTRECDRNGFNHGNVAACCRNCYIREGNNVYKGYIWSYTEI